MDMILEIIRENESLILIAMMLLVLILIVIQIVNKVHLNKLDKQYKKLFRASKTENIEDMIIDYGNRAEEILEYTKSVHDAYRGIDERISGCTQKVGIVRYKAFEDIGSDLSFSIALLDESDSGIILTGIYGRNDSTAFAKPIDNGISKYDLSDEEREAIEKAQKSFKNNNKNRMDHLAQVSDSRNYDYSHGEHDEDYSEEYDQEEYDDFEDEDRK